MLMRFRLEANGYEVLTAADGEAGLELARQCRPRLVLLDVVMPNMDGFEVLEKLKASTTTAAIPVIMLSARAEKAARDQAGALNAEGFVTKPCDTVHLLEMIRSCLATGLPS